MLCSQCGKTLPDESKFCGHCGHPVESTNPPSIISAPSSETLSLAPPRRFANILRRFAIVALWGVFILHGILLIQYFLTKRKPDTYFVLDFALIAGWVLSTRVRRFRFLWFIGGTIASLFLVGFVEALLGLNRPR